MNKIGILGIAAIIGIDAFVAKSFYDYCNGADICADSGAREKHYIFSSTRIPLIIRQNEPLDVMYTVADWNGLKSVRVKLDDKIIEERTNFSSYPQSMSCCMTGHYRGLKPGKHFLELELTDNKGEIRKDNSEFVVLNEIYNPKVHQ